MSKISKENLYDILKNEVSTQIFNYNEPHFRQIVPYSDSDHKSPSDMLNQMQDLVQNVDMEE